MKSLRLWSIRDAKWLKKGYGVHVMAYPLEDRIGEIVSRSNALNDREPWPLAA